MMVSEVTLKNLALGESISFSHSSRSHVLEYCDFGNIPADIATQKQINMDGLLITSIKLQPRTVTLVLWFVGANDAILSQYRRQIYRIVNPKQRLSIVQNGYMITGYPSATPKIGTAEEVLNEKMSRVYIEVYCDNPLFTTESPSSVAIASWQNNLTFPLNFVDDQIVFGIRYPSIISSLNNSGDFPCGAVFTVRAKGEVVNPRLVNITTQDYMEFELTLQNGDTLVVDTTGEIPRASVGGKNKISSMTEDSSVIKMPVGISDLSYSAESGLNSMEVQIDISPLLLEVV